MSANNSAYSAQGIAHSLNHRKNQIFYFILSFLSFITFYLIFAANSSFAQTPSEGTASSTQRIVQNQYPSSFQTTPSTLNAQSYYSPQSPHSASLAIYNFSHAMSCILIGQSPISPCLDYKMYKDAAGIVRSVPVLADANTSNGVLGLTLSMVGEVVETKPVSSSVFIANLGEQIGIKSASAQVAGSGSTVLSPIFKLWEVSRNLAYLIMILVFLVVGLMVMFRQRVNPQTVISVQLALPGLVIGLIMITFSYFLASLISDIAFIGTNLVGYYFTLAQGGGDITGSPLINVSGQEENMLTIFSRFVGIVDVGDVQSTLVGVVGNLSPGAQFLLRLFAGFVTAQFILPLAGAIPPPWGLFAAPIATVLTGAIGALTPESVFALVIWFISGAVLMYSMFKLLFKLISNLLNIIFLTIASPFYFLMAALPGRQGIATTWFMNMLCYVLAFPAVVAMFYFAAFILKAVDPNTVYEPFRIANGATVTSTASFPLLGGINLRIINLLLAFGALVATPAIPDIICKAIGKLGPAGQMIGNEIQGDIKAGQGYYNQQTGAVRQTSSSVKRNLFGEYGIGHDENGFIWRQTHPSVFKNINRAPGDVPAGFRFWKWTLK